MKRAAAVMTATLMLSACGGDDAGETIRIGALLSTTGDLANVGNEQLEAVGLAVAQINAAGGVLGRQLELVHRDDATDETRGAQGAAELAEEGVSVVIGPAGSSIALASFESLKGKSVVQLGTSATSPALSTLEDDGYFFRTCASDALQGKVLAQRARQKGFDKVAILAIPGAYGEGLGAAFHDAFVAAGGEVTFHQTYAEGESSYATLLGQVFATSPQAVLLIAYPVDGARIIADYNSGFSGTGAFWFFTDGLADTAFVTAVGASGFSFQHEGTGPGTPTGEAFSHYSSTYQAEYDASPTAGSFSANAYDAVYLTALAMAAGGSEGGEALRDQLTAVSSGGTGFGPARFADAVAAIEAGEDVDYQGASGPVDLDTFGDAPAPYDIWKVSGGQMTTVAQGVTP